MGLKGFERRLERLVEGAFAKAFKSSLRPVELGRRLMREMDHQRTLNVRGETAAPNDFTVTLGPDDHEQFAEIEDNLVQSLAEAAREHAREEGYVFMGPVSVQLEVDRDLGAGSFGLSARFKEGVGGTAGGALVLSDGQRVALSNGTATIGRSADCTVHLSDSSVSRRHAEVRPAGDGWTLVDLRSTNGTKVNGATITERRLKDGDRISLGDVQVHFEAS
ncbi:MAG: FHA domain-containing protein [Actinobacteria bacterium]|nr:FHA domain-containing protein [Actinomycetota bacterium]